MRRQSGQGWPRAVPEARPERKQEGGNDMLSVESGERRGWPQGVGRDSEKWRDKERSRNITTSPRARDTRLRSQLG